MRVELRLQHADLRLVERLLVLDEHLLVALEVDDHAVELLGKLAQLVGLHDRNMDVQLVAADLPERVVQLPDGAEELAAHLKAYEHAHADTHQCARRADGVEQPHGVARKDLRLLQDDVKSRSRTAADGIDIVLGQAGQRLTGQKLRAQLARHGLQNRRARAVDRAEKAAQQRQLVLYTRRAAQQ